MASYNTVGYTELCIRSLHHYADLPFHLVVGDSASQDGSQEMLQSLAEQGWLELQSSRERREHAHWLDEWLGTARTDYVLFCDSDIQFLRSGFMADLRRAAERGVAMAAERLLPASHYEDWRGATYVLARPTAWMMLVHAPSLRSLNTSFIRFHEPSADYAEGQRTFDVAAKLYERLLEAGMRYESLSWRFRRKYRHFANASWGARKPMPVGRIRRRDATLVLNEGLERMRRVRPHPSHWHR